MSDLWAKKSEKTYCSSLNKDYKAYVNLFDDSIVEFFVIKKLASNNGKEKIIATYDRTNSELKAEIEIVENTEMKRVYRIKINDINGEGEIPLEYSCEIANSRI